MDRRDFMRLVGGAAATSLLPAGCLLAAKPTIPNDEMRWDVVARATEMLTQSIRRRLNKGRLDFKINFVCVSVYEKGDRIYFAVGLTDSPDGMDVSRCKIATSVDFSSKYCKDLKIHHEAIVKAISRSVIGALKQTGSTVRSSCL